MVFHVQVKRDCSAGDGPEIQMKTTIVASGAFVTPRQIDICRLRSWKRAFEFQAILQRSSVEDEPGVRHSNELHDAPLMSFIFADASKSAHIYHIQVVSTSFLTASAHPPEHQHVHSSRPMPSLTSLPPSPSTHPTQDQPSSHYSSHPQTAAPT